MLKPTVEKNILKGQNVFWPGVERVEVISPFKQDEVLGIRSSTGEVVGAGAVSVSSDQLADQTEGVACYLLTCANDFLYLKGSRET